MRVASLQKNGFNVRENRTEVFRFPDVSSFVRGSYCRKISFLSAAKRMKGFCVWFCVLKKIIIKKSWLRSKSFSSFSSWRLRKLAEIRDLLNCYIQDFTKQAPAIKRSLYEVTSKNNICLP